MREKILKLKQDNPDWGYQKIADVVGCAKNTVKYHLQPEAKQQQIQNSLTNRQKRRKDFKIKHGGCCKICGYNKCLDALHFHHIDSNGKAHAIADMFLNNSLGDIEKEVAKCVLICANCHHEIHAGVTKMVGNQGF